MTLLARMLRRLLRGAAPGPGKREGTAAKVYEISLDDLTAIRGIGTATQNRLHAAGIKSYVQLARASPEEVRMKVGKLRDSGGSPGCEASVWSKVATHRCHPKSRQIHRFQTRQRGHRNGVPAKQ